MSPSKAYVSAAYRIALCGRALSVVRNVADRKPCSQFWTITIFILPKLASWTTDDLPDSGAVAVLVDVP